MREFLKRREADTGGVERKARAAAGAARGAHRPAPVPGGRWARRARTRSRPLAVRDLTTGPAAAEGAPGPPALPARPRRDQFSPGLNRLPAGQGSGPAAHHACPSPLTVGSRVAGASPTGAAPCSTTTGPMDHGKADEYAKWNNLLEELDKI
ncbi:Krueppel-like factor 2 [Pongo abelii]|uniref:Krueppel-like factor 2 n=1 Tax=Pongo abelii TaxID=9601 RepID=UPI0023E75DA8|nr:Krueppel-like factor 2 [Pongo abelii]